jgi:hypothetical protein
MALRLGDTAPNFKVGSVNSYRPLNADLEADNDSGPDHHRGDRRE